MSLSTEEVAVIGTAPAGPGAVLPEVKLPIQGESDLLRVRAALRTGAVDAGLGLASTTKLVTAGSELARNILRYATAGRGTVSITHLTSAGRRGVRAIFRDSGPGIPDIDLAMQDGYTSAGSLGLGLPGSRRLVDEFGIESLPDGTTVSITQWSRS
jgi:serine/threonine-protein kinase RsbT